MNHHLKISTLYLVLVSLLLGCSDQTTLTDRGYRYIMHEDMPGPTPKPGEYAYFHVTMRAEDSVLNSSYSMKDLPRLRIPNPEEYNPQTNVIIDGLVKMSVGDSITLFFPLDSMPTRPPDFAAYDMIAYDLVMQEIKSDSAFKIEMQEIMQQRKQARQEVQARASDVSDFANEQLAAYKSGKIQGLQKTNDGLQYVIHETGEGVQPTPGNYTSVHYYGMLIEDGTLFDQSFERGEPYSFPLGQGRAIKGWDLGIPLLKEGGKASLFIPSELGYGESGYMDIPGGAQLYFYVELHEVN